MEYFVIFLDYVVEGVTNHIMEPGFNEQGLFEEIVKPYTRGRAISLFGQVIKPETIKSLRIFSVHQKSAYNIILPDGSNLTETKKGLQYSLDCLSQGLVDAKEVTSKFLTSAKGRKPTLKLKSNRVFIVHGTDHEPVKELKAILKEVRLKPIVLHEQPGGSRTIVEKLEKYSNVGYAFVILTPDDLGFSKEELAKIFSMPKGEHTLDKIKNFLIEFIEDKDLKDLLLEEVSQLKDRARQNVILEFGYFIGRLERSKVCCLYKGDIELPSDMQGICYLHFNNSVNEVKETILEELKAANITSSFPKKP